MSRYVAMSHHDDDGWTRMDRGAGASHWRPTPDPDSTIRHAARWTGQLNIPEMQVVDLHTGAVVWRGQQRPVAVTDAPRPLWEWEARAVEVAEQFPPIDHPADPWYNQQELF